MATSLTVKTQAQLDKIKLTFEGIIYIEGGTTYDRIHVKNSYPEAQVVAWGNSSVEARGNSSVVARENSSVVARGNSSVVAWENSSVEAWENSSVEAWGNVGVHAFSDYSTITLFTFAVCWMLAKAKVTQNSKTTTIITPKEKKGLTAWLEREAVEEKSEKVILYKRVSFDFKTQEGTPNETKWEVGTTVEHKDWNPKDAECGPGKFHACSRTYFCDEFRGTRGDRYVAIEVERKDLFHWEGGYYPHKIAFRKGVVLFECNKFECNKLGKKI